MNGSIFSAYKLIKNSCYMLGCKGKAKHPCYSNFGMIIFLVFFYINTFNEQCVWAQFYLVLKIFIRSYLHRIIPTKVNDPSVQKFIWSSLYTYVFTAAYVSIILLTLIMSMGPKL